MKYLSLEFRDKKYNYRGFVNSLMTIKNYEVVAYSPRVINKKDIHIFNYEDYAPLTEETINRICTNEVDYYIATFKKNGMLEEIDKIRRFLRSILKQKLFLYTHRWVDKLFRSFLKCYIHGIIERFIKNYENNKHRNRFSN